MARWLGTAELEAILKKNHVDGVVEVKRVWDRILSLKLDTEQLMLNIGCQLEEREEFWRKLEMVVVEVSGVVIGESFNIDEGNRGGKQVLGSCVVKHYY